MHLIESSLAATLIKGESKNRCKTTGTLVVRAARPKPSAEPFSSSLSGAHTEVLEFVENMNLVKDVVPVFRPRDFLSQNSRDIFSLLMATELAPRP